MSRARKSFLLSLAVLLIAAAGWVLIDAEVLVPRGPGQVFELIADGNPLNYRHTMCFLDGDYGLIVKSGTLYNRDSHIDFNWYRKDGFRVGVQGRERGVIADLGSVEDLIPGGSVADVLEQVRWRDDRLLLGGRRIWTTDGASNNVPVEGGHCYVAIVHRNRGHPDLDVVALLVVLEHEPGKRVKYRWCLL